jgi:hypothetical protein
MPKKRRVESDPEPEEDQSEFVVEKVLSHRYVDVSSLL